MSRHDGGFCALGAEQGRGAGCILALCISMLEDDRVTTMSHKRFRSGHHGNTVQNLRVINPGERDMAPKFSLETVNCLGCCAFGPEVEIDGKARGKRAPARTADVLENYE